MPKPSATSSGDLARAVANLDLATASAVNPGSASGHASRQARAAAHSDAPQRQPASSAAASGSTHRARIPKPLAESAGSRNKKAAEIQAQFVNQLPQLIQNLRDWWLDPDHISDDPSAQKEENEKLFPKLTENLMASITPLAKALQTDTASAAEVLRINLADQRSSEVPRIPENWYESIKKQLNDQANTLIFLGLRSIREAHTELNKLAKLFEKHPRFKGFPPTDAWRIGIDLDTQKAEKSSQAWARFETESGYMAGICRGLALVIQSDLDDQTVNTDFIIDLHHHVTQGVLKTDLLDDMQLGNKIPSDTELTHPQKNGHKEYFYPYTFRSGFYRRSNVDEWVNYPCIAGKTVTHQGLTEANERSRENNLAFMILKVNRRELIDQIEEALEHVEDQTEKIPLMQEIMEKNKINDSYEYTPGDEFTCCTNLPWTLLSPKEKTEQALVAYEADIQSAQTETEKLSAIARCCQTLEQIHPFEDGNARTFGILLVNRLLLKEGLNPAIIEDPNRFDGYSNAELIEEIRSGQAAFENLRKD
jgi:Fic/DOC family